MQGRIVLEQILEKPAKLVLPHTTTNTCDKHGNHAVTT